MFIFSTFNYTLTWLEVAVLHFCLTSICWILTSVKCVSIKNDSACWQYIYYKTYLVWAAQTILSLNALDGVVSEAPMKVSAVSVLPADRRLMLVAWISSGKPTFFRSSFYIMHLLHSLYSLKASFRRLLIPEVLDISPFVSYVWQ